MIRKGQCLPLAIGNVHGAIAAGHKYQKKVEARLNLDRLEELNWVTCIPLVMHGGSGIRQDNVRETMKCGIAKINVATEIRQPYEVTLKDTGSVAKAQQAVYERTQWILKEYLEIAGIEKIVTKG